MFEKVGKTVVIVGYGVTCLCIAKWYVARAHREWAAELDHRVMTNMKSWSEGYKAGKEAA